MLTFAWGHNHKTFTYNKEGNLITFLVFGGWQTSLGGRLWRISFWRRKRDRYIGNYYESVTDVEVSEQGEGPICESLDYGTYLPMIFQKPREISYYYADGQRIAMKNNGVVSYLYGDQLGSVSAIADGSGALVRKTLYHPWGTTRYTQGSNPTDYAYTGQMREGGIYFYNARWYDPTIGRFIQADTIVPADIQGTQAFDRYAYVNNNPLRYIDPSGNSFVNTMITDGSFECDGCKRNSIIDSLWRHYGWSFKGEWSLEEVESTLQAANSIKTYFNDRGNDGTKWIQTYLNEVSFRKVSSDWNPLIRFGNALAYVFPVSSVQKRSDMGWDGGAVVHELGHVFENIRAGYAAAVYGGGLGDSFYRDVGGTPKGFRFKGGVDDVVYKGRYFTYEYDYGYNSSADFFAQNFQYEILGQSDMIGKNKEASIYMNVLLADFASNIR